MKVQEFVDELLALINEDPEVRNMTISIAPGFVEDGEEVPLPGTFEIASIYTTENGISIDIITESDLFAGGEDPFPVPPDDDDGPGNCWIPPKR